MWWRTWSLVGSDVGLVVLPTKTETAIYGQKEKTTSSPSLPLLPPVDLFVEGCCDFLSHVSMTVRMEGGCFDERKISCVMSVVNKSFFEILL